MWVETEHDKQGKCETDLITSEGQVIYVPHESLTKRLSPSHAAAAAPLPPAGVQNDDGGWVDLRRVSSQSKNPLPLSTPPTPIHCFAAVQLRNFRCNL